MLSPLDFIIVLEGAKSGIRKSHVEMVNEGPMSVLASEAQKHVIVVAAPRSKRGGGGLFASCSSSSH